MGQVMSVSGSTENLVKQTDVVNTITETTVKNSQNCTQTSNNTQTIVFKGSGSNIDISQVSTTNLECFYSTTNQMQLTEDLTKNLIALATNPPSSGSSDAMFSYSGITKNTVDNTAITNAVTKFQVENTQECADSTNAVQDITFDVGSYYTDVKLLQTNADALTCQLESLNTSEAVKTLTDSINSAITTTTDWGNVVIWIVVIIAIVLVAVIGIYIYKKQQPKIPV